MELIGPNILKLGAQALCVPLHHLFKLCLSQITPIFKAGDRSILSNMIHSRTLEVQHNSEIGLYFSFVKNQISIFQFYLTSPFPAPALDISG